MFAPLLLPTKKRGRLEENTTSARHAEKARTGQSRGRVEAAGKVWLREILELTQLLVSVHHYRRAFGSEAVLKVQTLHAVRIFCFAQ